MSGRSPQAPVPQPTQMVTDMGASGTGKPFWPLWTGAQNSPSPRPKNAFPPHFPPFPPISPHFPPFVVNGKTGFHPPHLCIFKMLRISVQSRPLSVTSAGGPTTNASKTKLAKDFRSEGAIHIRRLMLSTSPRGVLAVLQAQGAAEYKFGCGPGGLVVSEGLAIKSQ